MTNATTPAPDSWAGISERCPHGVRWEHLCGECSKDPVARLQQAVQCVLLMADELGMVVTVERRALQPLAMGNASYSVVVRRSRAAYQAKP